MTLADLVVVTVVAVAALTGARRGLALQILTFVGLAAGAVVGSRVAPLFLDQGARSPWLPVAGLVGAVVGASLAEAAVGTVVPPLTRILARGPLRALDFAGGALIGAGLGLLTAWLVAVVALQQPSLGLRKSVQRSEILPELVRVLPPEAVLNALGRFDPLPLVAGLPGGRLPPPDPSVARSRGARVAERAVVKIIGTSCGLGVEGSGWVAGRRLVATNAHVLAGEHDTHVLVPGGRALAAAPVYVDAENDIALLRVPGLAVKPLLLADPLARPRRVALLGYPRNGPLVSVPGAAGPARRVIGRDAYGNGPRLRTVVPLRGRIEHGDSGGPAVDGRGRVVAMMYAATRAGGGGLGVPVEQIRAALGAPRRPVSPGPCAG